MSVAKNGDAVKIHYTGKLDDGTIFDSSLGREPLEFTIGAGHVIPGFEKMVMGMAPGESKSDTIPVDQAYGERRDDMIVHIDRAQLPTDLAPEVGQELYVQQPGGQVLPVLVVDIDDAGITIDANHPLAGQDLTFEIELVSIAEAPPMIQVVS
jgi:peptidylprolyl isomerase